MKNNLLKDPWTYTILIFAIIVALYFAKPFIENRDGKYNEFAQCLTEKGLTMYGTEWCSHCKVQKAKFGDSFQYINYTDCDKNPSECAVQGITGYPTWKINNESYPGIQSLEKLSQLSGCEL